MRPGFKLRRYTLETVVTTQLRLVGEIDYLDLGRRTHSRDAALYLWERLRSR